MVFGKFVTQKADMELVQEIYHKVFKEELGVETADDVDEFCQNALVYAGERPAGMGKILFDGERFTIAGVAVLPEFRGESYGDFLLRLLIDKAVMSSARELHLDARQGTEGFFEKTGFQKSGTAFEDRGAVWQPMILKTDEIHNCCNCGH